MLKYEDRGRSLHATPKYFQAITRCFEKGCYRAIFTHKPWRMIYAIREREVWIMAVVDGRRDLADLLFERLAR